ncbi:MAG: nucleotide-binding protein [Verrucomicrobia bacterium]|nr:nucleotide-binding protein [Verrucomicrobiota bacterium]
MLRILLPPRLALFLLPLLAAASPAPPGEIRGKVVESINAASYTYVHVDTGAARVWAAAPQFAVKAGDSVALGDAMPMPNYHSKTLNRTFEVVYFSGRAAVNGVAAVAVEATAAPPRSLPGLAVDLSNLARAAGGQTVAEVHSGRAALAGQLVTVRGRVVKFNYNILGRNWLHIRDGSGTEGNNNLTVTSTGQAKVGDLVVVTGRLAVDKDFGSGYRYALLVEEAKLKVE